MPGTAVAQFTEKLSPSLSKKNGFYVRSRSKPQTGAPHLRRQQPHRLPRAAQTPHGLQLEHILELPPLLLPAPGRAGLGHQIEQLVAERAEVAVGTEEGVGGVGAPLRRRGELGPELGVGLAPEFDGASGQLFPAGGLADLVGVGRGR